MNNLLAALKEGKPQLRSVPSPTERVGGASSHAPQQHHHQPWNDTNRDAQTTNDDEARRYFFRSGIDTWIGACPDGITFRTEIVPLSREEARALAESSLVKPRLQDDSSSPAPSSGNEAPSPLVQAVEQRLQACISSYFTKGCFVKLTTRSPKDSSVVLERAKESYKERQETGEFDALKEGDENADQSPLWAAFGDEVRKGMMVRTAKEAFALLLSSERIYEDLVYALDDPDQWDLGIAIREWDDRCLPQNEFRAFVWQGELTCVGQYFSSLCFPSLQGPQVLERVERDARAVFERVKDHIPIPCYMMDLVLSGEECRFLVEINPLDGVGLGTQRASTGLFHWDVDRDVMTGRKPVEVRVRKEPLTMAELRRKKPSLNKDWWSAIYG